MPTTDFASEILETEIVRTHIENGHVYHLPILSNGIVSLHGSRIEAKPKAKCEGSRYLLDARNAAQTALRRSHVSWIKEEDINYSSALVCRAPRAHFLENGIGEIPFRVSTAERLMATARFADPHRPKELAGPRDVEFESDFRSSARHAEEQQEKMDPSGR